MENAGQNDMTDRQTAFILAQLKLKLLKLVGSCNIIETNKNYNIKLHTI